VLKLSFDILTPKTTGELGSGWVTRLSKEADKFDQRVCVLTCDTVVLSTLGNSDIFGNDPLLRYTTPTIVTTMATRATILKRKPILI
jgi:hypothetical protein